ncbi:DegQ family serine endoprotease [Roseibium denhamense]|uniref:Probable periplasmic serine endoprotease DegP-like n=1 Tax=Roseibium denhamense TaxID=76305 RepID=A0ABY1NAK9_9HYPH|nr:DegQ family serine endoprotease [Roseibium denhamense]MTI06524.1 DegQ family serine endoprotease [Roseibium denhamense]SMP04604.1 serine protease Do [Roseibium denhamense]
MASEFIRRRMTPLAAAAASLAFGAFVVAGPVPSARAHDGHGPESVADLAENLADAVVNISTAQTVQGRRSVPMPQVPDGSPFQEFFEEFFNRQQQDNDQPRRVQSLGSGFVIDGEEGIIITNNHVIEGADEVTANFNDGTKLVAEVLGTDEKTDLAVLKVTPESPLKAVSLGDSDAIRVGDWVMAIGNPFGLGGTVTVGIVSARNRDINSGPYDNFIQTDASINRGNSGGPLFDMNGNVVGINTAIISPSGGSIGIGFAIPAKTAMRVIDQLREFGETRRGWLGVRIQEVTDEIAESLGMDEAMGALVAGVTDDGPAAKAEIEAGDVILRFDGKEVEAMRELPRMVAETAIGKDVEVVVLRKGEEVTISVTLERLEENEPVNASATVEEEESEPAETSTVLGMTLAVLDDDLRAQFSIDADVTGVVITEVEAGSSAEEKRVQAGDVIKEVAQEPVETPADVEAQIKKLDEEGRRSALLLLANPTGDVRFVPVRIEEQ